MDPLAHLQSPFFTDTHRELATRVCVWAHEHQGNAEHAEDRDAVDARCRHLVRELGREGLLRYCIRAEDGGALADFDVRSVGLIRETLAWHDPLADFSFRSGA